MRDAQTTTTTRIDPKDNFRRTALVISPDYESGSLDLVDDKGQLLARLNVCLSKDGNALSVDVIDVTEGRWTKRRALGFPRFKSSPAATRKDIDLRAGTIVCAAFDRKPAAEVA